MLSRAFIGRNTKSPKYGKGGTRSQSIHDDEDQIVGRRGGGGGRRGAHLTFGEVLQSSVQVMGESGFGISEKIVLLGGTVYAAKRFRKVTISGEEFGRRIACLVRVSRRSDYLVPVRAYLYAKRIKLVLCNYYPMGSLSDLLLGGRELGHTPLDWGQRLNIVLHMAKGIAFIHAQSPLQEKNIQMNVHGNIKASNILIKTDFSACVSDYGFVQMAEPTEVFGIWQQKLPPETVNFAEKLTQKCDIYNFGVIILDMLGGPKAPFLINYILERKEGIKEGLINFFEFSVEARERKQALKVLDIALACTNRSPEARPSIDQILLFLEDVLTNR